jgi:hypothetical protein
MTDFRKNMFNRGSPSQLFNFILHEQNKTKRRRKEKS